MGLNNSIVSKLQKEVYEQTDVVCVAGAALSSRTLKFMKGDTSITQDELSGLKKFLGKEASKLRKLEKYLDIEKAINVRLESLVQELDGINDKSAVDILREKIFDIKVELRVTQQILKCYRGKGNA